MAEPFIGEIRQFAGNFAPQGWALCTGQLLPISDNDALFSLIGTTYGGDGQTNFALPDLQGRVPIHVGSGAMLGQFGGSETVTLNQTQLPSHTHMVGSSSVGGSDNPAGNVWAKAQTVTPYSPAPGNATMNGAAISITGGNQLHENRIPFVAVNYIISLNGIYPQQS
jgi:microcystin-dependent protein